MNCSNTEPTDAAQNKKPEMGNPELYEKFNKLQYELAENILNANKDIFEKPARATVLDIGSGDGKVTSQLLHRVLPSNFTKLVAIDMSDGMTQSARKKYYKYEKIRFETFDFCNDNSERLKSYIPSENNGFLAKSLKFLRANKRANGHIGYDHITSFTTFHWLKNQTQAFEEVYKLLKRGGDIFITMLAYADTIEALFDLRNDPEWHYCMQSYDGLFPYQKSGNARTEIEGILRKCHFTNIKVDIEETFFDFDNIGYLRGEFYSF